MTPLGASLPERSYGCTFGCGNPYDFILITVSDGTTEFLCLPCMIRLASDMVAAITESDNPDVAAKLSVVSGEVLESTPGPKGRTRGHNAPATTDDPDVFAAYDGVITEDELPEAFR